MSRRRLRALGRQLHPEPMVAAADYHSQHPGVARHSSLYKGLAPPRHPSDRQEEYATMTARERYLFDLQGFIVIRGLLSTEDVTRMNAAFDANLDRYICTNVAGISTRKATHSPLLFQ